MVHRVFIAGHGKLPSGSAAKAAYETLALTVEVELKYGVILDVECTLSTELGRHFVADLLRGYSLRDGIDCIIDTLKEHYYGAVKQALTAALKDVLDEFERIALN